MQKWQYLTIKVDTKGIFSVGDVDVDTLMQKFNELGDDGWELISIIDINDYRGGTKNLIGFFKRKPSLLADAS